MGTGIGFYPEGARLGTVAGHMSWSRVATGSFTESLPDCRVVCEIDLGMVLAKRTVELERLSETTTS